MVLESGVTTERRLAKRSIAQVDKTSYPNGIKTGTNREYVHFCVDLTAI